MLHLLTEQQRHKVLREYKFRLVVVSLLMLSFALLIGIVCLVPSFLMVKTQLSALDKSAGQVRASIKMYEKENAGQKLASLNQKIDALKPLEGKTTPSLYLKKILLSSPAGIGINSYSYIKDDSGVTIDIAGLADTRDSLLVLQSALKKEPLFKSVNVPLSVFAKKTAITFNMKLLAQYLSQ